MKIILGNGINYNQFGDMDWDNFTDHFNKNLKNRVLQMSDGLIKKFVLSMMPYVYKVESLEEKLKYSDINYVVKQIEKNEWINLTDNGGYFDKEVLEIYWDILNGYDNDNFNLEWIKKDEVLKVLTSLSMVFFTSIHILFNDSIYDTLNNNFNMKNKLYNKKFIKFLNGFEEVVTLNVDGVLNKTNINARYPHGFLKYCSPKEYYEKQMKKVYDQDKKLFNEFGDFAKNAKTSPYEILFNYSSKEKENDADFGWQLETGNFEEEYKVHPLHKDVMNNWDENKHMNNIDFKFYKDIEKWTGDVLIIGVSLKGDEVIFNKIIKNEMIVKVYYYGSKKEFDKIQSDKFIYCGFWKDSDYEKK